MARRSILFVDDQDVARKVFKKMLKDQDVEITSVNTGSSALAILKTRNFPVIVLDLVMPEMDGRTLCRKIRAGNPHSIIYAYTAYRENMNPESLEKDGFDGCLLKTSDTTVLQQAIQGAFEKYEARSKQGR